MKITLELDNKIITEIENLLEFRKEEEGVFTKPTVQEVLKKCIVSIVNRERIETATADARKNKVLLKDDDITII